MQLLLLQLLLQLHLLLLQLLLQPMERRLLWLGLRRQRVRCRRGGLRGKTEARRTEKM